MLSYLLNKTYDDEMTKCLLISAIAKINSNINYAEQNLVNDIMERYSREKNTYAYSLKPQIKKSIKKQRRNKLMKLQKEISLNINKQFTGKTIPCIIEACSDNGEIVARSEYDALDAVIRFQTVPDAVVPAENPGCAPALNIRENTSGILGAEVLKSRTLPRFIPPI